MATPPQTAASTDIERAAHAADPFGPSDFDLVNVLAGEWVNYTRDFAPTNYRVMLRARATVAQSVKLHQVTGDRTQTNQVTVSPTGGQMFFRLTD